MIPIWLVPEGAWAQYVQKLGMAGGLMVQKWVMEMLAENPEHFATWGSVAAVAGTATLATTALGTIANSMTRTKRNYTVEQKEEAHLQIKEEVDTSEDQEETNAHQDHASQQTDKEDDDNQSTCSSESRKRPLQDHDDNQSTCSSGSRKRPLEEVKVQADENKRTRMDNIVDLTDD